jgi:hypothetical protein
MCVRMRMRVGAWMLGNALSDAQLEAQYQVRVASVCVAFLFVCAYVCLCECVCLCVLSSVCEYMRVCA